MNGQLTKQVKSVFKQRFKTNPLLVASPGRINLIGEHTDYNSGLVFPAAIDRCIVSALGKSEHNTSRIYSVDTDQTLDINLNKLIKLETGNWGNYPIGIIHELQKRGKAIGNFNLVFGGNIPIGAGLSSSAALENSIVFGLNELFSLGLDKQEMVQISMDAEHNFAGVACGIMDQFSTMFGKSQHAIFLNCADLSYLQVPVRMDEYQLVLINTNVKHELANSPYNQRKSECAQGLTLLQNKFSGLKALCQADKDQLSSTKLTMPATIYRRCLYVIEENERVKATKSAIENKQWQTFGQILFDSHHGLQYQYEVSCPELDFLVDKAKQHRGVIGSRMMGGGFGGCTLNLISGDEVNTFPKKAGQEFFTKFGHATDSYQVHFCDGTQEVE